MRLCTDNCFSIGLENNQVVYMPQENFEKLIEKYPFLINNKSFYVVSTGRYCSGELHAIAFDYNAAAKTCELNGKKEFYFTKVMNQKFYNAKNKDKSKLN